MDIKKIFEYNEEIKKRKYNIYDKILDKIIKKIEKAYKLGTDYILFYINNMRFDTAPFDIKPCALYVMLKLKKKKYTVIFIEPNILYVSWREELERIKSKKILAIKN